VHLRDLNAVLRNHPATLELGDRELVNFTRCIKFTALMKDVIQLKAPALTAIYDPRKLAYLQSQLRHIRINAQANDDLESRSLVLEAAEQRIHDLRLRELKSLGFRT
jgi:hypothetical protein